MSRTGCALEALGIATSLGRGAAEMLPRVLAGDPSGLSARTGLVPQRELQVGAIATPLPRLELRHAAYDCRNNRLALAILEQIRAPVHAAIERFGAARVGVVAATSTSGSAESTAAVRHHMLEGEIPASFSYEQFEHGGLAEFLASCSGARGPAYTVSTACSSSAKALVSARSLLRLGVCDAVIAGGVDTLCPLTAAGFTALEAVARERSNPFSKHRCGLNLGEGGALFLLTRDAGGIQLRGAGESSDGHHMSAPDPGGLGAERALRAALQDAQASAADVHYLNLHGTGTPLNDAMESRAVANVLGLDVRCSSTKPLVGHTLGAAGAIELAICWMLLDARERLDGRLPPHVFDGVRDPELAPIRLVERDERAHASGRALMLSNAFGFGGSNCCVALERADAGGRA